MAGRRRGEKLSQFVPLLYETLDCPAWGSLSAVARLVYIALKRRARPETNGRVFLSVRAAATECGAHRNTVLKAFRELQSRGFIAPQELGHLGVEGQGKATTWKLAELGYFGARPSKDYLRWTSGSDFPVVKASKPPPKKRKPAHLKCNPGTIIVTVLASLAQQVCQTVTKNVTFRAILSLRLSLSVCHI